MRLILRLAALAAVASTGCATMAHGTSQAVTVISEPSSAQVFVNGRLAGTTPVQVDLERWRKGTVLRVEKEGFQTREIPLKRAVSGWTLGNLVFANPAIAQGQPSPSSYPSTAAKGLALGFGIDLLSGAAFEFPKSIQVTLEPGSSGPRDPRR